MRTYYEHIKNGVPFEILVHKVTLVKGKKKKRVNAINWNFSCCDCGLTHNIVIRPGRKKILVYMWRRNRKTGQRRRWNKYPCKASP